MTAGYTPVFPPCPYCGGKVTGAAQHGEYEPATFLQNDTVIAPSPIPHWLLQPCNHKAIDYTITVHFDPTKAEPLKSADLVQYQNSKGEVLASIPAEPKGGYAITVGMSWYEQAHHTQPKEVVDGGKVVGDLTEWLPGLDAVVHCPAKTVFRCTPCQMQNMVCDHGQDETFRGASCGYIHSVQAVIVHLNDRHRWPRERIADWLETLDVDLTFPTEKPRKKQLPYADPNDKLVIIGPTIAAIREEARRRRRLHQDVVPVLNRPGGYQRLRGYHRLQYTVIPGTGPLDESLAAILQAYDFKEVGAEAPSPSWDAASPAQILKDMQAVKAQLEQYAYQPITKAEVAKYEDFKKAIQQIAEAHIYTAAQQPDPWPGEWVEINFTKSLEPKDPVKKALDHKASQSSHWAKFSKPTNPLKKKGKGH